MQYKDIDVTDYANTIVKAIPRGVLLTTAAKGKANAMVIGWGQLGTLWGKPTFTAFIRTSRETFRLIEDNPEFTVNIPLEGGLAQDVFSLCGTKSGRHHDKFAELGLTAVGGRQVDVPAIAEVPLTLECKVAYRHEMDKQAMPAPALERFYPAEVTDIDAVGNCYTHVLYCAEIVDAYVLEV